MNVCMLNHNLDGKTGAGRFGLELLRPIIASGIEVKVLTAKASGHSREKSLLAPRMWRLLGNIPKIRREFARADIIHALDGYPYAIIAAAAAIGLEKPLVITAIGTGAVQPLYRWHGFLLRWAYRRASCIIAISSNTRREILAKAPGLSIEVINHAVRAEEFRKEEVLLSEEAETIRRMRPYVMSVGNWKRRKGFEYAFPAFAEVLKDFPGLHYAVCGIGPKPTLTGPLGITERTFFFKGIRWPFLKALYKNAELFFLLPVDDRKDIEGFGLAFLEAAAAGLPVVGTKDSGAEDALKNGENGYLVAQRNAPAAAAAIKKILSDRGLKKKFSAASLAFAKTKTWQAVGDRYRSIYAGLSRKPM